MQLRKHVAEQRVGRAVQPQAKMPVRIAISDEMPLVGEAGRDATSQDRGRQPQHLVCGCLTGEQLQVQPFRPGRKTARAGLRVRAGFGAGDGMDGRAQVRVGTGCEVRAGLVALGSTVGSGRLGCAPDERHDNLVGEPALRT